MNENSVVLLDNFDAHVTAASHECVRSAYSSELSLLPPNCTHICQPLDVGVMGPLKAILCSKWLMESVDELLDDRGNIRTDADRIRTAKEKRLATINRTVEAWNEITADVIQKSFVKALTSSP